MNEKYQSNRRKLLIGFGGGIAGVSQLERAWIKPVVDSVILPVHATTTNSSDASTTDNQAGHFYGDVPIPPGGETSSSIKAEASNLNALAARSLSILMSDAQASLLQDVSFADLCIDSLDGISYTAKVAVSFDGPSYFEASGTIGGGPDTLVFKGGCTLDDGTFEVNAITAAGADFSVKIGARMGAKILPEAPGCPRVPQACEG